MYYLKQIALFLLLCIVFNCSNKLNKAKEGPCSSRATILQELFDDEQYTSIRGPLSNFIVSCPNDEYIQTAHYQLAESYFRVEDWVAAELEYEQFLIFFPSNIYQKEVRYKRVYSIDKQSSIPQRDSKTTQKAIKLYRHFLSDYPYSKYSREIRERVLLLRKKLLEKEMRTAQLYFRLKKYLSATIYYKSVLLEYEDLINVSTVYFALAECYIKLRQFNEAREFLEELEELESFDEKKLQKAFEELDSAEEKRKQRLEKEKRNKKFENL